MFCDNHLPALVDDAMNLTLSPGFTLDNRFLSFACEYHGRTGHVHVLDFTVLDE